VLAAIEIQNALVEAALLGLDSGALVEERFAASREALRVGAQVNGELDAVAPEATTGWRSVARELGRAASGCG